MGKNKNQKFKKPEEKPQQSPELSAGASRVLSMIFKSGIPHNWQNLRGKTLYIATPAYGGLFYADYVNAIQQVVIQSNLLGVNYSFCNIVNESLITRARNRCVAMFCAYMKENNLKPEDTYLLFIDADVGFKPESIWRLMLHGEDVVGGIYPKKSVNWDKIISLVKQHPDIKADELELLQQSYNLNLGGDETDTRDKYVCKGNLVEVENIATGFMMIKGSVIHRLMKENPDLAYNGYVENQAEPELRDYWFRLFDCKVSGKLKRYLSEDWAFCSLCRALGIKIFADISIPLTHTGTFCYRGWVGALYDQFMTGTEEEREKYRAIMLR
jgi:hypothetical protein